MRVRADLVIGLQNVTLAPGGIATMDITALSDANDNTLSSFALDLVITPIGSASSQPYFLLGANQPTSFYGNASYVFNGVSFNADPNNGGPLPLWSDPGPSPPPNSYPAGEIVGGDEAEPLGTGFVTLRPGQTYLLAEVQFSVPVGASLTDEFNISLNTSSSGVTGFSDQSNGALNFTSTPALVTLSVPEPSSLVLGMMGLAGVVGLGRPRRSAGCPSCRRLCQ
jgi:hypothetical protein